MNIRNLFKNDFIKNVITLLSGSAISQVFIFLIMPVLTRIYSEELFGVYFVFVSTINILKKFTTLRFELAIILPKKDIWAINAWAVTIFFTFAISGFFLLIGFVFRNLILQIPDVNKIAEYIYLIPASLFFTGIYEAFSLWNNRFKTYKKISAGKITLSVSTGLSQLSFGFLNLTSIGLFFGLAIGQFVSAVVITTLSIKSIAKFFKDISLKKMIVVLKRYKKVPLFNSLINVALNVSNELPIYLLTGFYSLAVVGFYGMSNRLAAAPMDMMGRSVGQVFYQKATEEYNSGKNINKLLKKTYSNLFKTSILPLIGLIAISPFLSFIFGEEWKPVTIYLLILIPSVFANFIIQPVSSIYTITERQGTMLIFNFIMIFVKFAAIWLGFFFFDNVIISVGLLSLVTVIYKVFLFFWYLKISEKTIIS